MKLAIILTLLCATLAFANPLPQENIAENVGAQEEFEKRSPLDERGGGFPGYGGFPGAGFSPYPYFPLVLDFNTAAAAQQSNFRVSDDNELKKQVNAKHKIDVAADKSNNINEAKIDIARLKRNMDYADMLMRRGAGYGFGQVGYSGLGYGGYSPFFYNADQLAAANRESFRFNNLDDYHEDIRSKHKTDAEANNKQTAAQTNLAAIHKRNLEAMKRSHFDDDCIDDFNGGFFPFPFLFGLNGIY